ncbi:STAS domain-containing protein [Leeuwenhoekiella sp. A16]|uniref:STAS domain-containing protein n=1 Tax=unclassified Leeuwenhoekiella TaxID=2615029 RepID=UPI003A7FDEB4|tara:strand:- start:554 stop:835 length:282 start_codon:yes stop_codon:yes gene_type:complete
MALASFHNQVLELSGIICSGNVTETQSTIECALDLVSHLVVNLDKINMLDLSGVFMLYLIQERARKKQKNIILTGTQNEAVKKAFNMAGVNIC